MSTAAASPLSSDEIDSWLSLLPYASEQERTEIEEHLTALAGLDPLSRYAADPLAFVRDHWPAVRLYDRQQEVLLAVRDSPRVYLSSAHQMGKDFTAALAAVWYFSAHPVCRVVATSVKDDHLRILFGEVTRFLETASPPLLARKGGRLLASHREVRKLTPAGTPCPISYLRGCVSERGEGMAGHHAPATLFIADEASGVDDAVEERTDSWAKRSLVFGNPYPCENFFKRAVQSGGGTNARVLRLRAEDSPNVRLALEQQARGEEPTGGEVVPGVISWAEYLDRRSRWDPAKQAAGLDAVFYEGPSLKLFPPDRLAQSAANAARLAGTKRKAKAAGVDPGEGAAETALYAADELGVVDELCVRTPDTSDIPALIIGFLEKNGVPDHMCLMDRGGGGKQAYDQLRKMGRRVRTLAFGSPPAVDGRTKDAAVEQAAYKNVRAQMYGELSDLIAAGFAIPAHMRELLRQLAAVPRLRDGEGRLWLPPKQARGPGGREMTMTQLVGCSPDRSDALVLAVHALLHPERKSQAGAWAW